MSEDEKLIARLRARVDELERLMERRSRELRLFQRYACHRDLIVLSRIAAGLSPVPSGAFAPEFWSESTDLTPADVADTLQALWRSLFPELDA